jgi:hypothetical protein
MKNVTETRVLAKSKKLIEQSFMLKIRFGVMLFQKNPNERSKQRLLAVLNAFQIHLNVNGPSYWFEESFVSQPGLYAGFHWFVSGSFGNYRLHLNDKPFESSRPASRPSLLIVNS